LTEAAAVGIDARSGKREEPHMTRFPEIAEAERNTAQQRVAEAILTGPRGSIVGPFLPLFHSPELCQHVQRLGTYVRFECPLPEDLKELAILVTARHWSAQFEWYAHRRFALKAGVDPKLIDAIARRQRPDGMSPVQAAVYDFASELHRERRVSDATFALAREHLDRRSLMDLVGLCGYYGLIAMVLNVAEVPVPEGAAELE
jgi:4-carboxymuconolactone decarboxylase